MTIEELLARGVTCCGGALDFRNVNIGRMTADGPLITPDGEALLNGEAYSANLNPSPVKAARKKRLAQDVSDAVEVIPTDE